MPRTIIDMTTTLSDQETGDKIEMFLLNNKFHTAKYRGEEWNKIGGLKWRPGYLKILYGNGMVHIEAFYLFKYGREVEAGNHDPYGLQNKIAMLLAEIGAEQPDGFPQAIAQPAPVYRQPFAAGAGPMDAPALEEKRAEKKKRRERGCLIVLIVLLALLGGCTALVMMI